MVSPVSDRHRPNFRGHGRALLVLALPLIGSHLAQYAVQITDTVMMGWYSVEGLAGLVLAGTFYFILFIVGSGFAWAVMPMVASAAGTEDDRQVRRVTRMALWLSAAFGAAAMVPMLFAEPLLIAIRQPPEAAAEAAAYLQIAAIGLIPNLLIMVMKSYLAALEHTRVILVATLVSALLNGLLNYALIFGNWGAPELGIAGAALASVMMQGFGLAWLIAFAHRVTPQYALFQNLHRPDPDALHRVFQLGWPIGLTSLAEIGLFSATSVMIGWIGIVELAAHGVALQIISVLFMIHVGLSNAITVRAGQAFGRADAALLREGALVGLSLSGLVVLATIALLLGLPHEMVGAFVKPSEPDRPQIIAIGVSLLAVATIFQAVDAAQVLALGLLRGVQDTRAPMLIAAVCYWGVGIPASYVLGFTLGYGAPGVWFGLVIGLAGAAVFLNHRFWTRSSRI